MTNHTLGMMSCYPKGIDQTELNIIDAMIRAALVEGISLGVFDGEEWAVRNSTDYQEITGEIAATDSTTLRLRDSGGASCSPVGSDWLPTCKAWTIAGAPDDAAYHLWASLPEGDAHRSVAEIRGSYPKMAVLDECSALTTITVVVEEAGLPWPLIYTIDVISIADEDAILRQIADIRYSEINDDGEEQDPEILKATLESLTLHFALAGDVKTLVDWRN